MLCFGSNGDEMKKSGHPFNDARIGFAGSLGRMNLGTGPSDGIYTE
jgi:hypothetical protein